jgi:hypothetical protein
MAVSLLIMLLLIQEAQSRAFHSFTLSAFNLAINIAYVICHCLGEFGVKMWDCKERGIKVLYPVSVFV